jgi:hypothetical protein
LGAVVGVQFGEDVGDVVADGSFAEEQLGGDLVVSAAARDQLKYFVFAGREVRKRLAGCSAGVWRCAVDEVEESLRGAWTEDGLSASDAVDDSGDLVVVVVFEEVAVGAGADGGVDEVVFVEHAEDYYSDVGVGGGDLAGGFDPVKDGHAQVHDDDVGLQGVGEVDGLLSVSGEPDDVETADVDK